MPPPSAIIGADFGFEAPGQSANGLNWQTNIKIIVRASVAISVHVYIIC